MADGASFSGTTFLNILEPDGWAEGLAAVDAVLSGGLSSTNTTSNTYSRIGVSDTGVQIVATGSNLDFIGDILTGGTFTSIEIYVGGIAVARLESLDIDAVEYVDALDVWEAGDSTEFFALISTGYSAVVTGSNRADTVDFSDLCYVETAGDLGVGADVFIGTDMIDSITGGAGTDSLSGAAGNDSLSGNAAADTLAGGGGDDTLNGDGGNDSIAGGAGADVINGGADDDVISGGTGADCLNGNNGNDTISGGSGDDCIDGGNGADSITGGGNDDTIYGGAEADTIDGGADDDVLLGNNGDDVLMGNSGDDFIFGHAGNDTVTGGGGDDTIEAGAGDDSIAGGNGSDDIEAGAGHDIIYGGSENDYIFTGWGADTAWGGSGDDLIVGWIGDDIIYGGEGDDKLGGDGGIDTLYGGTGRDEFVYVVENGDAADPQNDVIMDFSVSENDQLEFYEYGNEFDSDEIKFNAILADAVEDGDDLVFTNLGEGQSLTLINVQKSDLALVNFDFDYF